MRRSESSVSLRKPKVTAVFRFEPGFQRDSGVVLLGQEFFDAMKGAAGGHSASFNNLL